MVDKEDAPRGNIPAQVICFSGPKLSPRSLSSRDLPQAIFRLGLLVLEFVKEWNNTDGRKKRVLTSKIIFDQIQYV